jgi:HAD superfamily hydrolase (TIGR01509 family)
MSHDPASPRPKEGAVLFDVDGTLVDTNYLHVFAWVAAFQSVGHPVDSVAIHQAIGMGGGQLIERLIGPEAARQVGERAHDEHRRRYRETFGHLRRFEEAAELLRAVARQAVVVLATSANEEEVSALRRALDAEDAITAVTGGDDVGAAKPDPDVVAVALEKAAVPPDRAVFVGDTVWDVEAAGKAGLPCVAVLTGGICREALRDAGAVAVYADVAELLAAIDDSPLAAVFAPAPRP